MVGQEQLANLLSQQIDAIGSGEPTPVADFRMLMDNLSDIPKSGRADFQNRCISHLLELRGQRIPSPDNLHPGDVIEDRLLGIPRKNNSDYGDLLGLELKSFSGGADLTLGSYSIVEILRVKFGLDDMWDIVYCPSHINHADIEPTTHFIKANEGIYTRKKTYFDKLKLEIEAGNVVWSIRRFEDSTLRTLAERYDVGWKEFDSRHLDEVFKKYMEGVIILKITGKKSDPYFVIDGVYFYALSPEGIADLFNEGIARYEARYAFKDKRENEGRTLYHGKTARNTGHAFRIAKGKVRKNMLKDEFEIIEIGDFNPNPYW